MFSRLVHFNTKQAVHIRENQAVAGWWFYYRRKRINSGFWAKAQEESSTQTLLSTKHKLDMSSCRSAQFDKALSLVKSIVGDVERKDASHSAKQVAGGGRNAKHVVENEQQWRAQHRDMVVM